jgi:hypothetical protein
MYLKVDHTLPFNINKYSYLKHMGWTEVLSGSAMGTVIVEIGRYVKRKIENKNMASKSLVTLNDIYSKCMKPVLENTPIDQFLILKAENGGGNIVPGTILYLSAIYEDYRPPFKSSIEKINRSRTDKTSIEIISALCSQGSAKVITNQLPTNSKFRDLYVSEHIVQSELYFLAQRKDKIFYASLATTKTEPLNTAQVRNEISISIDHLREIFKKSIKYL